MLPIPWTFLKTRRLQITLILIFPLAVFAILKLLFHTQVSYLHLNLDICLPKNNLVFLKTHKCAGSAIQNILMRYGDAHNLTFVLPWTGNYMGHPAPFRRTMIALPLLPCYNIFAVHARLNYSEIRAIMPSNSAYITIIRDPVEVFESVYSYYGLEEFVHGDIHKFITFVPNLINQLLLTRFRDKFGSNQMFFDLGADPDIFHNDSLVKQYINKLDGWFHLVLIADRMDESLVLLKHLLCWDTDDIVAFKMNSRDNIFKKQLNEKEKEVLRQLNHADVLLYNHFVNKFDVAVKAFGKDRMTEEVKQLRERTQKWYDLCVKDEQLQATPTAETKYFLNPKVVVLKGNTDTNYSCKLMTMEELPYIDILREKQNTKWPQFHF